MPYLVRKEEGGGTVIGISLEASSWRGAFTAGVLRTFGMRGAFPDLVSGSSAGACNGAAYISGQLDVLAGNWIDLAAQPIVDLRREARRANAGSIFNMSRIFHIALDRGLRPEALEALSASPVEFLIVATRLADRAASSDYWNDRFLLHYPLALRFARMARREIPPPPFERIVFSSRDPLTRQIFRAVIYASGRIPILYAVRARIDGAHFIDGGFTDKNPVEPLLDRGCDRVLAIVSRPDGIVRESFFHPRESAAVQAARREGRLLVIHPQRNLGVSKYSWSVRRVKRAVRLGEEAGEAFLIEHGDRFFGA